MSRLPRFFGAGHIWHITHRCHDRQFLLKFARDRQRWLYWLREARRRYDLCVLNYIVTSNHIHLLVQDQGAGEIAASMQLIAGRTAQEYNERKERRGAFWQERYRVTAVESDAHLARCMVYIDLNMVRAGVVEHPAQWVESGYHELQGGRQRYRAINLAALEALIGVRNTQALRERHARWIESSLLRKDYARDGRWTESLAVGSAPFVERIQKELGVDAAHREIQQIDDGFVLQEPRVWYGEARSVVWLQAENRVPLHPPPHRAGAFPALIDTPARRDRS